MNLLLVECKVSLLTLKQVATRKSSRFTILATYLRDIFVLKKMLVSSVERMKERGLEDEKMLLIYIVALTQSPVGHHI